MLKEKKSGVALLRAILREIAVEAKNYTLNELEDEVNISLEFEKLWFSVIGESLEVRALHAFNIATLNFIKCRNNEWLLRAFAGANVANKI